jgi:hypothetical protein
LWGEHYPELAPNEGGFIVTSFQKIYSMMKSNKDEVFREILNIKKKSFAVFVDEEQMEIDERYKIFILELMSTCRICC